MEAKGGVRALDTTDLTLASRQCQPKELIQVVTSDGLERRVWSEGRNLGGLRSVALACCLCWSQRLRLLV